MPASTFPARLGIARKAAGLTVEQLAKKAGCTKSLISQYEKGRVSQPRMELLFGLSDALNVSPRWLALGLGMQGALGCVSDSERHLLAQFRTLPKPMQEHVYRVIESLAAASADKPTVAAPFGKASIAPKR